MLKKIIRLGAIEVVFLALGVLAANVLAYLADTSVIWRDLGTPPSQALRIQDGDYQSVRVQTTSGEIYFCQFSPTNQCWIRNGQPTFPYSTRVTPFFGGTVYRQPPPLSALVDTKKFYNVLSEYNEALSVYAITTNGHVYVWQDGLGNIFALLVYSYEMIPLALLCGLIVWGIWAWGPMRH